MGKKSSRTTFNIPLPKLTTLPEIALHKGLAKIGDGFVNLVYSLAKSQALKTITGWKVSTEVLTKALHDSELRSHLPSRLTAHQRADGVEAILGYLWLSNRITLEEVVETLTQELSSSTYTSRAAEKRGATQAFTKLLLRIKPLLPLRE
ncbi:MAG: ribonuclease III family protein [Candidatus Ranarchaeia archaeon]